MVADQRARSRRQCRRAGIDPGRDRQAAHRRAVVALRRSEISRRAGVQRGCRGCRFVSALIAPQPRSSATFKRLQARLRGLAGKAIEDFAMIQEGDRVMACLSGGKDSYTLLDILLSLRRSAPVRFELVAVNLDQKQPGFPEHVLPEYLRSLGVPFHIENQDTYSIVKDKIPEGKTMCSLCSRLRRGILYRVAGELGATKVALGHHRDDMIQTLFMNMFFGSRMKGMPPKLVSDDGKNIVIGPLAYVAETDLERWA